MLSIGIDWADDKHDICIRDAQDRRILAEFIITHDAEGVKQLDEMVAALGFQPADCLVAVETPHGLLVGYLLQTGYTVYAIPPRAVERYRDRHRSSGAQSDKIDARTLSDILCVDREYHRPIPEDSPLAQEIKLVSRQRQKPVQEQTRIKNQLTACLKAYYPAALGLFSSLDCAITWAFLLRGGIGPPRVEFLQRRQQHEEHQRAARQRQPVLVGPRAVVGHTLHPPRHERDQRDGGRHRERHGHYLRQCPVDDEEGDDRAEADNANHSSRGTRPGRGAPQRAGSRRASRNSATVATVVSR